MDVFVDDGMALMAPMERTEAGPRRIAWVSRDDIRKSPYGGHAVITSKGKLSGANRHKKGSTRTITLFHEHRNDPEMLNQAAILASVVAAGSAYPQFRGILKDLRNKAEKALGISTILDVWARSSSSPLPIPCPMKLEDCKTAHEFGRILRVWHTRSFEKRVPVAMVPVVGGATMVPIEDFEKIVSQIPQERNRAHGNTSWKSISNEALEKLVWAKPVMIIADEMDVSGAAVAKRCARLGVDTPPRGYWQQLESGIDPRDLLARGSVEPPLEVQHELSARFDLRAA